MFNCVLIFYPVNLNLIEQSSSIPQVKVKIGILLGPMVLGCQGSRFQTFALNKENRFQWKTIGLNGFLMFDPTVLTLSSLVISKDLKSKIGWAQYQPIHSISTPGCK